MNGWMLTTGSFGPRAPRRDLLPRGLPQLRQRGEVLRRVDVVRLQRGPRDLLRRGFMRRLGRHGGDLRDARPLLRDWRRCYLGPRVCVRACPRARRRWRVDVSAAVARERLEGSLRGRRRDRRSGAWTRRASSQWDDRALLRVTKVSESPRARSGNDTGERVWPGNLRRVDNDARRRSAVAVAAARCAIAPTRMRRRPIQRRRLDRRRPRPPPTPPSRWTWRAARSPASPTPSVPTPSTPSRLRCRRGRRIRRGRRWR